MGVDCVFIAEGNTTEYETILKDVSLGRFPGATSQSMIMEMTLDGFDESYIQRRCEVTETTSVYTFIDLCSLSNTTYLFIHTGHRFNKWSGRTFRPVMQEYLYRKGFPNICVGDDNLANWKLSEIKEKITDLFDLQRSKEEHSI